MARNLQCLAIAGDLGGGFRRVGRDLDERRDMENEVPLATACPVVAVVAVVVVNVTVAVFSR